MKKTCSKCKVEKEMDEFYKNKSKKDGLSTYCKHCSNVFSNKYRKNNPEKTALINIKSGKNRNNSLSDCYIKMALKIKNPPPELIEIKREQLFIHRLIKGFENETTK